MRIFLSAGEPSGDLHGANLIRALRELHPDVECVGFGGERMEAAGGRLLYPLCRLAVMWFLRVLLNAQVFLDLLAKAERYFDRCRPDAVVLIDYPGFNWLLARRAHARGIPVFYFVPPQLWGWAGWRVHKMRRWVDHVLCSLPFEPAWYGARGVAAQYVGHPYFDELTQQRLDRDFLAAQRAQSGPVVGLLPGSRNQEIERNLSTLLRAAERIQEAQPGVHFLVACLRPEQKRRVEQALERRQLALEVHAGRTAEIVHLASACIAVSGSVGLELLYHGKPAVVVYRIGWLDLRICRLFKTSRYISLVNLLANREIYPEYLTDRCEAEAVSGHVVRWLRDRKAHEQVCRELAEVRQQVAEPGACARAAGYILAQLGKGATRRRAA
jgi:lipid-A-disaccharide synthase